MKLASFLLLGCALSAGGCVFSHKVNVEPVTVDPIQVTVDVNVHETAAPAEPVAEAPETPAN